MQNYDKTDAKHIVADAEVNHGTHFYRIKGRRGVLLLTLFDMGGGMPPPKKKEKMFLTTVLNRFGVGS